MCAALRPGAAGARANAASVAATRDGRTDAANAVSAAKDAAAAAWAPRRAPRFAPPRWRGSVSSRGPRRKRLRCRRRRGGGGDVSASIGSGLRTRTRLRFGTRGGFNPGATRGGVSRRRGGGEGSRGARRWPASTRRARFRFRFRYRTGTAPVLQVPTPVSLPPPQNIRSRRRICFARWTCSSVPRDLPVAATCLRSDSPAWSLRWPAAAAHASLMPLLELHSVATQPALLAELTRRVVLRAAAEEARKTGRTGGRRRRRRWRTIRNEV